MIQRVKKWISLMLIYFFNCLPIKNNKIFLFSYYGSQYGCNPKYISEYILKHDHNNKFDIVWAFNNPESKLHKDFRVVKIMSLKYFYELCTSKVIITNFRTTDLFLKRRSQYYIQTWHSSLRLKTIEKDAEKVLPKNYIEMAKRDSRKCDLLLSGSKFSTDIFNRSFWYSGEIVEYGSPRNDILFQSNRWKKNEILNKLGISPNLKVMLYAPTFRKDNNLEVYKLDYEGVTNQLKAKFGGDWIVLVKLHPHLQSKSNQLLFGENVVDVTSYDDIQELLMIGDALISDYSSLIFDYAITKRPCFLYIPDVEEYTANDRKLYFDINELPFIPASSNRELIRKVGAFNGHDYQVSLHNFLDKVGSYDQGRACEFLLKRINQVCFSKERGKVYEKAV